jgi:hypothetical protein
MDFRIYCWLCMFWLYIRQSASMKLTWFDSSLSCLHSALLSKKNHHAHLKLKWCRRERGNKVSRAKGDDVGDGGGYVGNIVGRDEGGEVSDPTSATDWVINCGDHGVAIQTTCYNLIHDPMIVVLWLHSQTNIKVTSSITLPNKKSYRWSHDQVFT